MSDSLGNHLRRLKISGRKDGDELITAVAKYGVRSANIFFELGTESIQEFGTDQVAVGIVYGFELIDVNEQNRKRKFGLLILQNLAVQNRTEIARIIEPRRIVDVSQTLNTDVLLDVLSTHFDLRFQQAETTLKCIHRRWTLGRKTDKEQVRLADTSKSEYKEPGSQMTALDEAVVFGSFGHLVQRTCRGQCDVQYFFHRTIRVFRALDFKQAGRSALFNSVKSRVLSPKLAPEVPLHDCQYFCLIHRR